jgi:peptidyl-prolyl cis-trans isomerase D
MISWIQKYFQKHFRMVFAIVLLAMAIPLVLIYNQSSGFGRGDRQRVTERVVFGYNLASQDDQSRLLGDAALSAQLQSGYGLDGAELQNYAFQRAAALTIANQLHIPATTKSEIADHIKTLRVFTGQDGQFDAKRYQSFRDSLKANSQLSEESVSRVIADDVRSSKVEKLIGGPGYVQPEEVKAILERADTRWTLGVATVDYASFNPTIPAGDAVLTKYFEDNSARFEIPPRVSVSYVDFPAVAYLSRVTVTEPEVRAFYETNPARFPKPATDAKSNAPADPNAAFNAVRPQVETALKLERAQELATKAASDLSVALYDSKLTPDKPEFDSLLAQQKLTLKTLAPFTREAGPAEFGGAPEIASAAFKLSADRSVSDAVTTPVGAAILFWKETQPARKPNFAEVRAKVTAEYVEGEKRKRFIELGRTLKAALEARLKAGDTFEKAVAASANGVKIDTKQIPAFSLRQPPRDLDYYIFGALERLDKGRVSDLINTQANGTFVYVADKQLPDMSEKNPQYATTRDQVAAMNARMNSSAVLSELVDQELKRSEPAVH